MGDNISKYQPFYLRNNHYNGYLVRYYVQNDYKTEVKLSQRIVSQSLCGFSVGNFLNFNCRIPSTYTPEDAKWNFVKKSDHYEILHHSYKLPLQASDTNKLYNKVFLENTKSNNKFWIIEKGPTGCYFIKNYRNNQYLCAHHGSIFTVNKEENHHLIENLFWKLIEESFD